MEKIKVFDRRKLNRIVKRRARLLNTECQWTNLIPEIVEFNAAFRVGAVGDFHEEITRKTGLLPSTVHLRGEKKSPRSDSRWREDIWILESPLSGKASLDDHVVWLADMILPHEAYFSELIEKARWADLCLGCISNSMYPIIFMDSGSTELVKRLKLSLAFNFTC